MKLKKESTTEQSGVDTRRRQMLGATPLVAAAGFLWKPTDAAAQRGAGQGSRLVLDVACLGNTLRLDFDGAVDFGAGLAAGDFHGASFLVEGALYPAGTIGVADGFDPSLAPMMGHWLCRGWLMFHADRPEPHAITTQEYLLQVISSAQPSPLDSLVSSGVEGGIQFSHRAIIGGSGLYRHARGDVVQEVIGTNTTTLNFFGAPAPTFRFYFDF